VFSEQQTLYTPPDYTHELSGVTVCDFDSGIFIKLILWNCSHLKFKEKTEKGEVIVLQLTKAGELYSQTFSKSSITKFSSEESKRLDIPIWLHWKCLTTLPLCCKVNLWVRTRLIRSFQDHLSPQQPLLNLQILEYVIEYLVILYSKCYQPWQNYKVIDMSSLWKEVFERVRRERNAENEDNQVKEWLNWWLLCSRS